MAKKKENSLRNKRVTDIAFAAIIIAVMAILNFVPNVGYIKIIPGAFEITIIHLFPYLNTRNLLLPLLIQIVYF